MCFRSCISPVWWYRSGTILYKCLHNNFLLNEQTFAIKDKHHLYALSTFFFFLDLRVRFNRDPWKSQSTNREENNCQGNWMSDYDVKCSSRISSATWITEDKNIFLKNNKKRMKSFYFLWISRTPTLPLLSSSLTGSEWWTRMKTMIIKNEYLLQSVCWWEITVLLWILRSTSVWPKAWSVESILGGETPVPLATQELLIHVVSIISHYYHLLYFHF